MVQLCADRLWLTQPTQAMRLDNLVLGKIQLGPEGYEYLYMPNSAVPLNSPVDVYTSQL